MDEADSIKSALLQAVFDLRQITLEDYQKFYRNFLQKPYEEQREFLEIIQKIIQSHPFEEKLFRKS